jgi:predicted nucleic acid-binding Zn ribbon protein
MIDQNTRNLINESIQQMKVLIKRLDKIVEVVQTQPVKEKSTPKPLLYCCVCGKPRVKGDIKLRYDCSKECSKKCRYNYCIICGKKTTNGYTRCSEECYDENLKELWKKLND